MKDKDAIVTPAAASKILTESEVRESVASALATLDVAGRRVLLLVPDDTRTCPIGLMVDAIAEAVGDRVKALDVLIALGTHRPMPIERIYRFFGIDEEKHRRRLPKTRFLNHAWDDPEQLTSIGTISADEL